MGGGGKGPTEFRLQITKIGIGSRRVIQIYLEERLTAISGSRINADKRAHAAG
jgi:hypothetical protein